MNGSKSGGENSEEKMKNDCNSLEKANETPKFYKELMKINEDYKKNENKSSNDEFGERSYPIKEGDSLPYFSGISNIYSNQSQKEKEKEKENKDKDQEEGEGRDSFDSLISFAYEFLNQQKDSNEIGKKSKDKTIKINIKEEDKKKEDKKSIDNSSEEDELKDINPNNIEDINELNKRIKKVKDINMKHLIKNQKDNNSLRKLQIKLSEKEKIIQRKVEQINKCKSKIEKKYKSKITELENTIREQKSLNKIKDSKFNETEKQKNKNNELKKKIANLKAKILGQKNKNNQLNIEYSKLMVENKELGDKIRKEKQIYKNSKEKYNLILPINDSSSFNELKNALEKKKEMQEKKECNIKKISAKLKEKLEKETIKKTETNKRAILKKENSLKTKILVQFINKKKKYINSLKEKSEAINLMIFNNQKLKDLIQKELKHKNENNKLKEKIQILINENNELKNQNMILSKNAIKEKLEKNEIQSFIKNEIQTIIKNELSNYPTKNEINVIFDKILNNHENRMKEIEELKLQIQNNNDINDNNSFISREIHSQIIYLEDKNNNNN